MEDKQDLVTHLPFKRDLAAHESGFTLENPLNVRDGIKRMYHFSYLTIVPAYVSEAAAAEGMDDEELDPLVTEYEYYLEVEHKAGFFSDETTFVLKPGTHKTHQVMKDLNSHFDGKKPPGMLRTPVALDWLHPHLGRFLHDRGQLGENMDMLSSVFYTEPDSYNAETHYNVLPESARTSSPVLNNYRLPSNSNMLEEVRVRMCIAPNTRVSFSNALLLYELGFTDDDIGPRGANQQYHISNPSMDNVIFVEASRPPKPTFDIAKTAQSKMYVNVVMAKMLLQGHYTSTKGRESEPSLLLEDFSKSLEKTTRNLNFKVRASKAGSGKFMVDFPAYDKIDFKLRLSGHLASLMSFPTEVTKLAYESTKAVTKAPVDLRVGFEKGRAKAIDTVVATVALENVPSMNTRGLEHKDCHMAFLASNGNSALVLAPDVTKGRVALPTNQSHLRFNIYRQTGSGRTIGLAWTGNFSVAGDLEGWPV